MTMSFAAAKQAMTSNAAYSYSGGTSKTTSSNDHAAAKQAMTSNTAYSAPDNTTSQSTGQSTGKNKLEATDDDRSPHRPDNDDHRGRGPSSDDNGSTNVTQATAMSFATARRAMTSNAAYSVPSSEPDTSETEARLEAQETMRRAESITRSRIEAQVAESLSARGMTSPGSAGSVHQGRQGDGIPRVGDDMNALDAIAEAALRANGGLAADGTQPKDISMPLAPVSHPTPPAEPTFMDRYGMTPDQVIAQNAGTGYFGTNFGMRPENKDALTDALQEQGGFMNGWARIGAGVDSIIFAPVQFVEDIIKGYVAPSSDRNSVLDEPGSYYRQSLDTKLSGMADLAQVGTMGSVVLNGQIERIRGNSTPELAAQMGQGMVDAAMDDPLEFTGALLPGLLGPKTLPGRRVPTEADLGITSINAVDVKPAARNADELAPSANGKVANAGGDAKNSERPPVTNPTAQQVAAANDLDVDARWVRADGAIDWPPNSGFADAPKVVNLQPGARIDRYGSNNGGFLSPAGTPFEQRALPNSSASSQFQTFEVVKPLPVNSGQVTPWFGQPGGGTQYQLQRANVQQLIDEGYLRIVN